MIEHKKITLRITYFCALFLMIFMGNTLYGTPMDTYSYMIFIIIYFSYYLLNFLDFDKTGDSLIHWVNSFLINFSIAALLWSFSKSPLLVLKFSTLWFFSNILRIIFYQIYQFNKSQNTLFLGSETEYLKLFNSHQLDNQGEYFKYIPPSQINNFQDILDLIEQYQSNIIIVDEDLMRTYEIDFLRLKTNGYQIFCEWQLLQEIEQRVYVDKIQVKWFLYSEGFDILHNDSQQKFKRIFDILMSITLASFTLPIMIFFYFILLFTIKAPIYKQTRVGLQGQEFDIIKFRSMSLDAESNGARWAEKNDSRITKIGRFMRKTRIDELPQLWNVFKGDMSFIGPRPERRFFIESLEKEIPFYSIRHSVKPGITGWAQVKYPYGASIQDAKNKLEYDLYYIKNQNIMFDIIIFFKTVKTVLSKSGQ